MYQFLSSVNLRKKNEFQLLNCHYFKIYAYLYMSISLNYDKVAYKLKKLVLLSGGLCKFIKKSNERIFNAPYI